MPSLSSMPPEDPEYAWELATLFPRQGEWEDSDYLRLTDDAKRRIELADGRLEFLAMPTEVHEALVRFLFLALYQFVEQRGLGQVYSNGIRVRIGPGKFRLPDVLFLSRHKDALRHNRWWDGADLVMEVVSDHSHDRRRDYETKLADYSEAGVMEYWIVDPLQRTISIYALAEKQPQLHGPFPPGTRAASMMLANFGVDVSALFAVVDQIPGQ